MCGSARHKRSMANKTLYDMSAIVAGFTRRSSRILPLLRTSRSRGASASSFLFCALVIILAALRICTPALRASKHNKRASRHQSHPLISYSGWFAHGHHNAHILRVLNKHLFLARIAIFLMRRTGVDERRNVAWRQTSKASYRRRWTES